MIKAKVVYQSERRPYADMEIEYEVTADNESAEEVERYCTEKVHRCSTSSKDDRGLCDTYYVFRKWGENKYLYRVIEPNCD